MILFDVILLIIIGGFVMFGFWFGFFHTLGSLFGTVFGAFLASRLYEPMADWLISVTGWGENISSVFMFVVAFFIINRLIGFGFWVVDRVFHIVTYLPFVKGINRFLGMTLGFAEGVITVGLFIYFIERVPLSEGFMNVLANSVIAPVTSNVASILWPLLPDALKLLQSTVDYLSNTII